MRGTETNLYVLVFQPVLKSSLKQKRMKLKFRILRVFY